MQGLNTMERMLGLFCFSSDYIKVLNVFTRNTCIMRKEGKWRQTKNWNGKIFGWLNSFDEDVQTLWRDEQWGQMRWTNNMDRWTVGQTNSCNWRTVKKDEQWGQKNSEEGWTVSNFYLKSKVHPLEKTQWGVWGNIQKCVCPISISLNWRVQIDWGQYPKFQGRTLLRVSE